MELFINHNGNIIKASDVHLSPDNRSFKYGDGCFETMKVVNAKLPLRDLHFDRLFSSLPILKFTVPNTLSREYLDEQIFGVVDVNNHQQLARVRLTIYRGNGELYEIENNKPNFVIQSCKVHEEINPFDMNGLTLGIYPPARKSCDIFSSLKSNNYLLYTMGAMWAKENRLDDCFVLNCHNRIADATIANVFIVVNGNIKTPSLNEGCVNGVMRRYLLNCFKKENIFFSETEISVDDVLNASEVFLTNAVYGIRWVKKINDKSYKCSISSSLYKQFVQPLNYL